MPTVMIIPEVGDYVAFYHKLKGKVTGRIIEKYQSATTQGSVVTSHVKKVVVRYWFDAFAGWCEETLAESNVTYIEKPVGYKIPLDLSTVS